MIGNRRKTKAICVVLLTLVMLFTGFGEFGAFAAGDYVNGSSSMYRESLKDVEKYLTSTTYEDYRYVYRDKEMGEEIVLGVADYDKELTTGAVKVLDELDGSDGQVVICGDDSTIKWTVNFEKDALYNVYIEYYTGIFSEGDNLNAKSDAIERYIFVDDNVPYKEARSIKFEKIWADSYTVIGADGKPVYNEDGTKKKMLSTSKEFQDLVVGNPDAHNADSDRLFLKDVNGNELKPDKELVSCWTSKVVRDSTGYYAEPLCFYFSAGQHTFGLQAVREPMAIRCIKLVAADVTPTYEEYLAQNADKKDYTGDVKTIIQAEYPVMTSANTIYSLNDRSSSYTVPQDSSLIRLNMIGGDKWQYVGQWIEWEVNVPESGFYQIVPRSIQNFYSGIYVSRKIYINGSLPFKEAGNLRFNYSSEWQNKSLNDGKQEFKFYLNEGKNVIRMEVVLGDMAEILGTVENSLAAINAYYRKILMITGPDADKYRDYGFDKLIPDVLKGLRTQAEELYRVSDLLTELTGAKGEHSSTLDRVALVCERMGTYPDTVASQMEQLKTNTASLGTWLSDTQNQPLDIDFISIQAVESEPLQAEPGFFGGLWYELQKFWMSFFSDYNSLGSVDDAEGGEGNIAVEAWIASSRDQAQILRTLADDYFTPNYEGINIDIKLVVGGTLLPATLAGTGPDVYIGGAQGDPVNYAIRSAVLSLNHSTNDPSVGYNFNDLQNSVWNDEGKYPSYSKLIRNGTIKDFNEVSGWFAEQAMVPVTLYGETYALPMTMSFSMMFYRKDIFVELGIQLPNTWDDFYDIIYSLQSNSLDIGFPTGTGGSMVLMYQQNDTLYKEGNYEHYLDLFRKYYYDGDPKDYNNLSEDKIAELDRKISDAGLTYINDEGKITPKTDGMAINLDSDISLAAFKDVCRFFTDYDFPVTYNFANRFRSGELPLAVIDYTSYNTLIVFAPEISGLWAFAPLPGVKDELTQEINNVTIGAISTIMMMRSVDERTALGAWAFMQWYMSADIQSAYGNEMVALLGPSAKQPTANLEALGNMSWSTEEYKNLESQFKAVACTPEYPGSYIIGRYTGFAFLDVYNKDKDPVKELQSYITDINSELDRKRLEFKLPTTADIKEMESAVKEKFKDVEGGN